jgi:hypothetical protein
MDFAPLEKEGYISRGVNRFNEFWAEFGICYQNLGL